MAWTEVKCNNCTEVYSVQMYGHHKDRDWKQKNWSGYCDNCKLKFKEIKQAEFEKQNQQNAEMAKESGYVELMGTPKQIQWAETLRIKRVEFIKILIGKALSDSNENYAKWLKIKIDSTKNEKNSSFFIDRRNNIAENFEKGYMDDLNKKKAEKFIDNN